MFPLQKQPFIVVVPIQKSLLQTRTLAKSDISIIFAKKKKTKIDF